MTILSILLFLFIAILFYTYLGYPLVLILFSRFRKTGDQGRTIAVSKLPKVALLIAAYNEEKVIADKIHNSLSIRYPEDLLSIWIASDGSSDRTNAIVKEHIEQSGRVHLLEFPRTGKSGVINKVMPLLQADVVVFSDANTELESDVLERLIPHFDSSGVGCVSGRLVYRNPGEIISGKGESFYWRYETFLKRLESELGYVAGANGALYAIRRELFRPLPPKTINDDFTTSMSIVEMGYKSLYEENALAFEDVAPTKESEYRRHVRDGAGHYIAVRYLSGLLNPFLGIRSFIYWSHRILRWAAPFILILLLPLNFLLARNSVFFAIFLAQSLFYILAIVGYRMSEGKGLPFAIHIPYYFCNLNVALFVGFLRVITGRQKMTWESTAR